jgi:hypothetical protein
MELWARMQESMLGMFVAKPGKDSKAPAAPQDADDAKPEAEPTAD